MHPLWNLFPAILLATLTIYTIKAAVDDIRADTLGTDPWFRSGLALLILGIAAAATISAAPIIAWTIGALS